MTPQEWREVASEIESLWGPSKRWAKAPEAYKYAAKVPRAAAMSAVEELYLQRAKYAPSPADVLGAARGYMADVATPDEIARYCTAHGHVWSIISESSAQRHVRCSKCGYETDRPAESVPTDGEIANGVFDYRAADANERIAP